MTQIKFGTDGWRAIIAKDYTVENVARVAEATAAWLLKLSKKPSVVIGYDPRFGGKLFAETTCKVLSHHGIKTYMSKNFSSTPMVSLATVKLNANLGIVITASHNPPAYNGFKLKGAYGGPLLPEKIEEIEKLIPKTVKFDFESINIEEVENKKLLEYVDFEDMYINHIEEHFDLDAIRNSGIRVGYDAMYGAGQNVMRRLFPDSVLLHCENNPSFHGQAPEPIHKNLQEFSELIKNTGIIDCGIATDGDADRIGLYDDRGNFVDSHHLILLLIKYLYEHRNMRGKVVTAFSVSPKVNRMCEFYKLEQKVTKIGFKHIASHMVSDDVLLGGEESGGIAIKGHIPERDGIWIGLTILEFMSKTGKSIRDLIKEVYEIVGEFAFERSDLHLHEEIKNSIVANCENNAYTSFGDYKIQRIENIDGYKYFFNDDEWVMIRASGTEPVLRNYAQSNSQQNAFLILKAAEQTLLNHKTAN
ncbi:MAG: phosphoglucosamine mutase [Bacteroidetes bacterium]|jgi:phosphomannomutase|nr:phosphoglucosamine mutase [Bacteroidota bacterium]